MCFGECAFHVVYSTNLTLRMRLAYSLVLFAMILGCADSPSTGEEVASDLNDQALGPIVSVLQLDPEYSGFLAALDSTGLTTSLSGPGPFTVLAFTNSTIARQAAKWDSLLLPAYRMELMSVLTYHMIQDDIPAEQLRQRPSVTTIHGTELTITTQGPRTIRFNDRATFLTVDIEASNGRIHEISEVLIPVSTTATFLDPQ